jgi:tetrahydromethanopterin S-methyltransferase subunit E
MQHLYPWFIRLSAGMGLYGFSRGYRAQEPNKIPLIGYSIMKGIQNGIIYVLPGWNIVSLLRLINRLEIHARGLNRENYPAEYMEIGGYCFDTV